MGKGNGSTKIYPPTLYGKVNKFNNNNNNNNNNLKPLPSNYTIDEIIKSLPHNVFETSFSQSIISLILSLFFIFSSLIFLLNIPLYLYPIGWFIMGASFTSLLVIGNNCAHNSFFSSSLLNNIVGTIVLLPLLYPFHSFKLLNNNKNMNNKEPENTDIQKKTFRLTRGGKFYWLTNLISWAEYFFANGNNSKEKNQIFVSILGLYGFIFIFFSTMINHVGVYGLFNYWLVPWLVFHFIVSTVNLIPSVPIVEHQKYFTDSLYFVHVNYPEWFEFIIKNLNYFIPNCNLASSIPHYNRRKAYLSLKDTWGDYIYQCDIDTDLMRELFNPLKSFINNSLYMYSKESFKSSTRKSSIGGGLNEFLKSLNWLHVFILCGTPLMALLGVFYFKVPLYQTTLIWSVVYYYCTGFGITLLYHRALSHKAFTPSTPVKVVFLLFAAGAVEGSARWWCRDHRAHHRYTDTDKDPYSAQYGFWWSHIGWLLVKQNPEHIGKANMDDLYKDEWIRWQHRHFIKLAGLMGLVFPTVIAGLGWGDWTGGLVYSGFIRLIVIHHTTFLVNSLAHYLGETPFDDNHTPKDSIVTAILTLGEGYHNFHHEFPQDYRNAIKFYQYDPTKWLINLLYYCGLVYDLKTFSNNEVQKGIVQMAQKKIDSKKENIYWGAKREELPLMDKQEFDSLIEQGKKLIIINDFVHDVKDFLNDHPGGINYINMGIGKDATQMFKGDIYGHSRAAQNLLCQFRIANFIVDKDDDDQD